MKQKVLKSIYLLTLILTVIVVSCTDDFPFKNVTIPEGEGTLSATVTFTPITAKNLGTTRTPGDAIQNIESLCVLVYGEDGNFVKKYTQDDLKDYNAKKYDEEGAYEVDQKKDYIDGNGAHTDEKKSAQATFTIPDLPYGRYYMFAVANMGDLPEPEYDVSTIEKLQNIELTWDKDDIKKNNQMFGYFTPENDAESKGFQSDKPLEFTGKVKDSKIHAWLKRAASKVTVAFDPSGLNQGVTIYIRNVTVRDIPKYCLLGAENTPTIPEGKTADDILWNHLASYSDPDYKNPASAVTNSRLEYDSKGVITTGQSTGANKTDGLRLDNSIHSAVPENAHAVDAPSLFFYENNQNVWLENQPDFKDGNGKKNDKYNKQPQKEGDDKIGTTIHNPEYIPDTDKLKNDFKDRVPLGTYVEVEAYYISSNPANPGEGTIKYRFMLGKDTSFDYDAQRNYHYKLTLGFKGWANDPDWHIDYIITTPDIEVPPVFRVSYLYQQMSELPIKIVGDIEWLTVTITENNWAPYDPNSETNQTVTQGEKEYLVPQAEITSTTPTEYQFKWNYDAFIDAEYKNPSTYEGNGYQYLYELTPGEQKPQFGFLALHLPTRETTAVKTSFSAGANEELIRYWFDNQEGIRRFRGNYQQDGNYNDLSLDQGMTSQSHNKTYYDPVDRDADHYTVKPVLNDNNRPIEGQRILMLPLWTRTKTLIEGSGFSGNNPYEAFERKATVHISAQFNNEDSEGNKIRIQKDVEVYQVKRLTNPKGVWRAHNRTDAFNVTLLEAINSNAESNFQPFTSQGEWSAYIESQTNSGGFSIRPNGQTNGYVEGNKIHGNTGSEIHFTIDFGGQINENQSECAIIKVLYHGNQCLHKILVRKGYNEPLKMGGTTDEDGNYIGGKLWSSFSLYQATPDNSTEDGRTVYRAILTKNPLMLGSMFRRGSIDKGIFVWNNMQDNLGPLDPPNGYNFTVGELKDNNTTTWTNKWEKQDWTSISYRNDVLTANRSNNLGRFYAYDDEGNISNDKNGKPYKYRVPTYAEFQALTDNSEFGFGVFYGSEATEPQTESKLAYGLIDPYNEGLFTNKNGMRAVVAYDKGTGNQILFPVGRYGMGIRRQFNIKNANYNGVLRYSDVYEPLIIAPDNNNLYRPIPYNLPIVSGAIYWIDVYVPPTNNNLSAYGYGCLGWDMNYFNFDFNAYTANNYADACQIKFVIDE